MDRELTAGVIFALTYLLIILQRVPFLKLDRPSAVSVGATLMIAFGVLSVEQAFGAVDMSVLVFLGGMMILVAYLELSGFFELSAAAIVRGSRGPRSLLAYTILASALLSALFVNDTICLLFTPILLRATRSVRLNPMPYLIAIATASNIGSVMSVVGNPQNMFIGERSKIPFHMFFLYLSPATAAGLVLDYAILAWLYRRDVAQGWPQAPQIEWPQVRPILLGKTIVVFGLVLTLFIGGRFWGITYSLAAMIGGAILLVLGAIRPRLAFKKVSWTLLLFFFGLFIVMEGFRRAGLSDRVFEAGRPVLSNDFGIGAVVAVLSNLVSNVPAVILFEPYAHDDKMWLLLALSSTLAGNLTLIGSVANLIVAECAAEQNVTLGFWEYLKVGLPLTLATLALGTLWLSVVLATSA